MENWKLIQKYISGNAEPEERREIRNWMDQDPKNKKLIRQLEQIWELTPEEEFAIDAQAAWEKFRAEKIKKSQRIKTADIISNKYSDNLTYFLRTAAIVLVAVLTGFFVQYTLTDNSSNTEDTSHFNVMQDLVTGRGEKAQVTFTDGTKVILNAASTLRFPKKFDNTNREVYLDGEAYFEVTHDPEKPFIVHVQNTKVRVLGTAFNIRGWEEDSNVDVAVRSGRVIVSTTKSSQSRSEVVLSKDQFTRVLKKRGIEPVKKINIENYLLWTHGGLHFDNVPFMQVLKHLERKFDVQINVADSKVLNVPFTGTFKSGELDEILNVVAASMKMEYSRDGTNRDGTNIDFN